METELCFDSDGAIAVSFILIITNSSGHTKV